MLTNMIKKLIAGLLLSLVNLHAASTLIIAGTNTLQSIDGANTNSQYINFMPPSGSTVTLNPPQFTWNYQPYNTIGAEDSQIRRFRLEVSYTNFGAVAFSNMFDRNFTKTTKPFTNGTSPIYWRVTSFTNAYAYADVANMRVRDNAGGSFGNNYRLTIVASNNFSSSYSYPNFIHHST